MNQSLFNLLFYVALVVLALFGWRARARRRAGMTLDQRQQDDMNTELRRIRRKMR